MLTAGTAAPVFELESLGGGTLRGGGPGEGPRLLAFFKITCPTCQLVFPYLQRLADRTALPILAVSQDGGEGTREFHEEFGIRLETALDPKPAGYRVSNAYRLTVVPTLYLVEPDGVISFAGTGFVKKDLEALAEKFGATLFGPEDRVPEYKPG